jgi:hypothetical protein
LLAITIETACVDPQAGEVGSERLVVLGAGLEAVGDRIPRPGELPPSLTLRRIREVLKSVVDRVVRILREVSRRLEPDGAQSWHA